MSNDLWRTPKKLFDTLNDEFGFIADMAASKNSALCNTYFSEDDDSLSFNWNDMINVHYFHSPRHYVYCNPPYSKPMPWIKQAIQAQKDGLGTVMLLNADASVSWFTEALKYVSEIRFVTGCQDENDKYYIGRIAFTDEFGVPHKSNNKPQFVLVFNPFKVGARVTTYITKQELCGE